MDVNLETWSNRVEDSCPSQLGKELSLVVVPKQVKEGMEDTGLSSIIFVSPNRFKALVVEEESSESSIPSEGEENIFMDHIRKSVGVEENRDMQLTRSKTKLSLSNEGNMKKT